jgi:hypothetical protein
VKRTLPLIAALLAGPALADETRQLDAHEHGVGQLNIAFDGNVIAIELQVPGADIVGFEHPAESAADRAAIDGAVATLARPLDLFRLPDNAACSVTQASAELASEASHHAADEADTHQHDHDHDHDHAAAKDDESATHTEFHAEYLLTCADPDAISEIGFTYFDSFANARELQVQIVAASGARVFEVLRDAPLLDLRGMF